MGMAIDSIRTVMDPGSSQCGDESSQDYNSLTTTKTSAHPLAQAIAGGGVLGAPGGGDGDAAAATSAGQTVGTTIGILFAGSCGGDGGRGGIAYGNGGLQESANQLEEDRKMRRRQVERTVARLSRVRIARDHTHRDYCKEAETSRI